MLLWERDREVEYKAGAGTASCPGQELFPGQGHCCFSATEEMGKVLVPELGRRAAEPFDKVCRNEIPPLLLAKPQVRVPWQGLPPEHCWPRFGRCCRRASLGSPRRARSHPNPQELLPEQDPWEVK